MADDSRQADALSQGEIEVTPAMVEAGVVAICDYEPERGVPLSDLAVAVFKAMASKLPISNAGEDGNRAN